MIGSYHGEMGVELRLVLVFKCAYHCSCCCHPHCNHFDKNNNMNLRCYDNLRADGSCGVRYLNTRLYLCDNKYFDYHLISNHIQQLGLYAHVQNYAVSSLGKNLIF